MNNRQQLVSKIKKDIIENCEEDIKEYYGIMIPIYDDIDSYLDCLDNIYDKISLAQWANNFKKVEELINELNLTEEQKSKYNNLKEKNIDIDETINFEILTPKYDFLNDMLDMLTTDRNIQEQILSLSDEMLEVFKILYIRLEEISDYNVPYITNILRKIGYVTNNLWENNFHYYDELNKDLEKRISEGYQLTDIEIETLLFLYNNNNVRFEINNIEDLLNFGKKDTKDQIEIDELINNERNKSEKNIDNIKTALLLRTYGIDLKKGIEILKKYDLSHLEINSENKDLFEMYKAIALIVNENNPNLLISVYDNFSKEMNPQFDFMRITTFENDLRKEFARSLNREVLKTENRDYTMIDGIKVYEAGLDFKIIVTAIGAYQKNFKDQEDYNKYWNSPIIRSHGNCCSLIGNNNLSMAQVKNIILGFSTMNDNMLLLCGNKDLNSTPESRKFNTVENTSVHNIFTSGSDLLDNTRGDYNELVYERRDLSSNPTYYKKNPDYIVFIEEYEDIDMYIELFRTNNETQKVSYLQKQKQEQERMWNESLKAAKDFGIPIVKINREKCAKNEFKKIESLVLEFEETKNPDLISKIITQFHNNRFGNKENHPLICNKYFSKELMEKYLERINNVIINLNDSNAKHEILNSYRTALITEEKKIDYYRYIADTKKLSAIDFEKTLKKIDTLSSTESFGEDSLGTGKKGK